MKLLLYLGLTQKQYWQRTAQGWQALNEKPPSDKPVWVVTNLPEEGFAEIEIPRVFGKDRQDLLQRQLATHFPETGYRARLNLPHGTSLLDKLAPTRHTLFGVSNAQKIDDILDEEDIQVAALCSTSLLLTQLGRHKTLPKTLFVVLADTESLRIIFIKNRIPYLTRLTAIPVSDTDAGRIDTQIEEIIRTHRYLENTHSLEEGQRLSVLLLGDATEFATPLSRAGLSIATPPPPWDSVSSTHRWHPIFDLAIHRPAYGQLAPTARRARYLAGHLRRQAWITSIGLVLLGVMLASLHINDMRSILHEKEQAATTIATLNQQSAELDRQTLAFGASSELIRRALALDTREILEAPSFEHQLTQIAQALHTAASNTSVTGHAIRLNLLHWAIISPSTPPCVDDRTMPAKEGSSNTAPTDSAPSASQQAQISFDLLLPSGLTQRSRLDMVRNLSTQLKSIPNIQLWGDPNISLSHATLKGGAQTSIDETPLRWCMTLTQPPPTTESPMP